MLNQARIPLFILAAAMAGLGSCSSSETADEADPAEKATNSQAEDQTRSRARWDQEHALIEGLPRRYKTGPFSGTNCLILECGRDWEPHKPGSKTRLAEFTIPGGSITSDAHLTVYWFSGAGGSTDQNLRRWADQFDVDEDVDDPMLAAHITILGISGSKVTRIQISGTYIAERSPGSSERYNEKNWGMDAAVMETNMGPLFIKVVGPKATLDAHKEWLNWMFSNLRLEPADEEQLQQTAE